MRSDLLLRSDVNFFLVISTPCSLFSLVDVETIQSKRIFSFSALFNLMNGAIKFSRFSLPILFEDGRPATINSAPFGLQLF